MEHQTFRNLDLNSEYFAFLVNCQIAGARTGAESRLSFATLCFYPLLFLPQAIVSFTMRGANVYLCRRCVKFELI